MTVSSLQNFKYMKALENLFSQINPPVDEKELNKVEVEINIPLPQSLRNLYQLANGGYRSQTDRIFTIYLENKPLGDFIEIYDVERLRDVFLLTFKKAEAAGLEDFGTNRFIAFSDIGQAFICIGHTGEDLEKIFWIDTGDPIDEINFLIFKLADSLEEFFESLRPSEG